MTGTRMGMANCLQTALQQLAVVAVAVVLVLRGARAGRRPRRATAPRRRCSSGSNSWSVPRPVQVGQAPCGLLKEKVRGSISGRLVPQLAQAKCSLKVRSAGGLSRSVTSEMIRTPLPSLSAVSTESVSRVTSVPPASPPSSVFRAADHDAVDHGLDGVHLVAVEVGHLGHVVDLAVDAGAHVALLLHVLEDRLVVALAVLDQRGQDQQAAAFGHLHDAVDDLRRRLLGDGLRRSWGSGAGRCGR